MKKGISMVSLIIIVVIMIILAGIVIVNSSDSMETATINMFTLEVLNIQNAVDEYRFRYETYPVGEEKILNMYEIPDNYEDQFRQEIITNGKIAFKLIDMSLLGINDTEFGNQKKTNDVYVLSEETGKVYYLAGVEHKGKVYYTLTNELSAIANITDNMTTTSTDIKVYDVVFIPSTKEYTNQPITVTLKLPKQAIVNSITTTNSKSVSEETIVSLYKQIEINATSEDKTGNYKIVVNYTHNNDTKTAEYEVTNYDATVPMLNCTEQIDGDYKTVTVNASDNESGIKIIKYELKEIQDTTYFAYYGRILSNNKIIMPKNYAYTVYVEDRAGNHSKKIAIGESTVPAAWQKNVHTIYNGVPIPKGFVASQADGENTKNGGLVIYEGTDPVTDDNVFNAKRERNQYVWVPVEDFSKFVRKDYTHTPSKVVDENRKYYDLGTSDVFWEVVVDSTNTPKSTQNSAYMTTKTLKEAQEMYKSVKEYKGFYIARYEAGIDIDDRKTSDDGIIKTTVYSRMNKAPYNYVRWTYNDDAMNEDTNGAVQVARIIYPETNVNVGVVSTLTYGVQWDRTLAWWVETKAQNGTKDVTIQSDEDLYISTNYGNYDNNEISTFNTGASVSTDYGKNYIEIDSTYSKKKTQCHLLTTGATEETRINNIYDMAGNLYEWTMEGYGSYDRILRGGYFYGFGGDDPVSYRTTPGPYDVRDFGVRPSLYIKLQ